MKPEYIKRFEKLGFGMFVHFGLYSTLGRGEWVYYILSPEEKKKYFSDEFANKFNPKKDWATKLVRTAKKAGAKYITLTTKHHEGFFLYDSKCLTKWDSVQLGPKRDLVREFVDACNKEGIVPFFYHALLDWHNEDYNNNFPKYIDFLIKSVELLCSNYGKIGGLWFDGFWDKPNEDWQFDRLYKTIRKYQPEAMIINNTGMSDTGSIGHYEIDSVTYERSVPTMVNAPDGKERAGEMCEVFGQHWGYTKNDLDFKSFREILYSLIDCRNSNCNFLLNCGPQANGYMTKLDEAYFLRLGEFIRKNKNFIYNVKKADISSPDCVILQDENYYYAVIKDVLMSVNPNAQLAKGTSKVTIPDHKIKNAKYLDCNYRVELSNDKHTIFVQPFDYGEARAVRVIRFE